MRLFKILRDWWKAEDVEYRLPSTMNNAAPRDHFAKVREHFDAQGNYIFKNPALAYAAKVAKSFAAPSMPRGATMVTPAVLQQAYGDTTTASLTLTFASGTSAGSNIIVCISAPSYTGITIATTSGTWTKVAGTNTSSDDSEIWEGHGTAAGTTTVNITGNAAASLHAAAMEWSGLVSTGSFDTGNYSLDAGGTTTSAPSTTASVAGDVWILTTHVATTTTYGGAPSPFTSTAEGGGYNHESAYYVAAATDSATYTGTWSLNASSTSISSLACFKRATNSAPSAPTLQSPANASYQDVVSGLSFSGVYNPVDTSDQTAYAMRIKVSGNSYSYYNASTNALQSSIVWNPVTTAPGGTFGPTLPAGALADGNVYNWSMASQESGAGQTGTFATDFTFTAQADGTVTISAPIGLVSTTSQPTVSWTDTLASGAVQTNYEVIIESGNYGTAPGSGTQVWSSGIFSGAETSATVGVALTLSSSYRAFVQITQTGSQVSPWAYSTFTMQIDVPATPSLVGTPGTDPTTGAPMVTLALQALDNQMSQVQSAPSATSVAGWTPDANTTLAPSDVWATGSYSLGLNADAAGNVSATTPTGTSGFAVVPGSAVRAMATFESPVTARSCTVAITFYDSTGATISTVTSNPATSTVGGAGAQAFLTASAPSNAASASVALSASSLAAPNATLSAALTSGTAYTSLSVTALTTAISSGQNVVLVSGGQTQTFVASAAAAIGATSISVTSLAANYSYPVGALVDPDVVFADEMLFAPGSSSTWSIGGFVGGTVANFYFSDDGTNWFAVRNGSNVSIPASTQQVSVIDYEGSLGGTRHYQAEVVYP